VWPESRFRYSFEVAMTKWLAYAGEYAGMAVQWIAIKEDLRLQYCILLDWDLVLLMMASFALESRI
jgi:hypothetical protein